MKSPLQQAFIVHRLDREASGLMIFARNESTRVALQRNWKNITKRYLAVVAGAPSNSRGTLKDHLLESKSFKVHRVDHGGELAITHYRVLGKHGDKSLLELTLETGRKNPNPGSVGRRGPSDHRRSEIRRENRAQEAAGATFVRAQVLPSELGHIDGVSQRSARTNEDTDRTASSHPREMSTRVPASRPATTSQSLGIPRNHGTSLYYGRAVRPSYRTI
jgi:RNA pseudouridylate synthase